jgi:predicted dehydrogenase
MRRRDLILSAAPLFVPRSAFGANDRVTYGVIATGGRGRYMNRVFQKCGAQCVALCDVYQPYLDMAAKESPGDAKTYVDYNELLQQPGLDAVVIASPDHQHYPMLKASVEAKKDVYLEKPLSKSLEESRLMIDLVKRSDRVVQIGMQRRSAEIIYRANALIQDGALGVISMIKPQWNWAIAKPLDNSPLSGKLDWSRFRGPAPQRDLEPMRFRYWRYFWDYAGGNMTDQGTHLMDVVQWFTRSGPPKAAVMSGMVGKMKGAEHPDTFCAVFEMPDYLVTWTLNYNNSYQDGWSITFMGDKGTMVLNDAGFSIYQEPWRKNPEPYLTAKSPVPVEPHVENFLDCMKTRKQPRCPVDVAAAAVAGPHLANLAWKAGKRVEMP